MPVDLGSVPGSAERFQRSYLEAVQQMKRAVEKAAAGERSTHAYRNRTGNLEAHTTASDVISTGTMDAVTLEADMPYASYVNARGLMGIDETAERASAEIQSVFDGVAAAARL